MRDISKVVQGLCMSDKFFYDTRDSMISLWVHECLRVFSDRLVSNLDRNLFKIIINDELDNFQTTWNDIIKNTGDDPIFIDFMGDEIKEIKP